MNVGLVITFLFMAVLPLRGQSTQAGQGLAGTFAMTQDGNHMMLVSQVVGTLMQGALTDSSGYSYLLEATLLGEGAEGMLTDPRTGNRLPITARLIDGGMQMIVYSAQADGSYQPAMQMEFVRESAAGNGVDRSPGNVGITGPSDGRVPPTQPYAAGPEGGNLDSNLVGTWRHTRSSSDPLTSFSMVVEYTLWLSADGTYVQRTVSAGGGSGVTVGGGGGQVSGQGKWQTRDKILWLEEGTGWRPFARYTVDSSRMMFIFGDDTRQLWDRLR